MLTVCRVIHLTTTEDNVTRQDFDEQPVRTAYCAASLLKFVWDNLTKGGELIASAVKRARPLDIWLDTSVLQFLQDQTFPPNISMAEKERINKRSQSYRWQEGTVMRAFPTGTARIVPRINRTHSTDSSCT